MFKAVGRAMRKVWTGPAALSDVWRVGRWILTRLAIALSVVLILLGLILLPLPFPLGLPLILLGTFLLLNTSQTAKRMFLRWHRKHPVTMRKITGFFRRKKKRTARRAEPPAKSSPDADEAA